jgi:hypothetical protein
MCGKIIKEYMPKYVTMNSPGTLLSNRTFCDDGKDLYTIR